MDFISSNKMFLQIFCRMGQSPCLIDNLNPARKSVMYLIRSNIQVITQTIASLSFVSWLMYLVNFGGYQKSSTVAERSIMDLVTLCELVKICSVFSQCLFYKNILINVISTFQYIEQRLIKGFDHSIPHRIFRKRYSSKCTILLLVYVTQLLVFIVKTMYLNLNLLGIPVKFLQFIKITSVLHSLFYIDMLTFLLAQLNLVLRQNCVKMVIRQNAGFCVIRKKLKCYKTIHFVLYESSQRISNFFGWSMAAMLLHGFIEFVYSFYWFIQMVQPPFNSMKIIRKLTACLNSSVCNTTKLINFEITDPLMTILVVFLSNIMLVNSCYDLFEEVTIVDCFIFINYVIIFLYPALSLYTFFRT